MSKKLILINHYLLTHTVALVLDLTFKGGCDEDGNNQKTTELYNTLEDSFVPYLDLPIPSKNHNILRLNETHFFFCGSHYFIFDTQTETWTQMPSSDHLHIEGFSGEITQF